MTLYRRLRDQCVWIAHKSSESLVNRCSQRLSLLPFHSSVRRTALPMVRRNSLQKVRGNG